MKKIPNEKVKTSFPIYLFMYLIASLIGFIEGGLGGLALGLASALICSVLPILALIPFGGIPLYLIVGNWVNGILAKLGAKAPIAQAFALYGFLVFAVILNVFVSIVVLVLILSARKG